jgi:vitamin B12 transporter
MPCVLPGGSDVNVLGALPALIALIVLLAAQLAFAQSSGTPATSADVETLVVTGSRLPRPLESVPASVTVITREEIERGAYTSLVDVMRHLPGIHLDQSGSRGSRASLYTRGLDPNHTVVMIDGVRVNDPTNDRGGSFDFSTLDPASIERIEIVRGPVSAVYGSDAIAGAVNIITRRGDGAPAGALDASGGRWGVYRIAGEARGEHGPIDLALGGGWVDEGEPPGKGRFHGGNAKANLGLALPNGAELRTALRWSDTHSEAYPEDSGGPELAVIRSAEERDADELDVSLDFKHKPIEWLETSLRGGYFRKRGQVDSPGIALEMDFPIPPASTEDHYDYGNVALWATARPSEGLSLTVGGDGYYEDGSSRGALFPDEDFAIPTSFDLNRWVGGPFGEVNWSCTCGLAIDGGVRADFPDSDDAEVTPRVSARYPVPVVDFTIRGSWGEGFKLPSFFALASPVVGDPGLAAEKSKGWDVGLERSFWGGRLHGSVTYFELRVKNLIDFDPNLFVLVNRSKVRSRGVETELSVRPHESVELTGNATYTDADVLHSSDDLLNRPSWRASVAALWTPRQDVTLRAVLLYVGNVKDSSVPTGQRTLESWVRVDLAAFWRVLPDLTFYVQIDNLFDNDYREAIGFPSQGIRPRAGITWRLPGP